MNGTKNHNALQRVTRKKRVRLGWMVLFFIALCSLTYALEPENKIEVRLLFQDMKNRFVSVSDYSCEMQVFSASGKKNRTDFYQFYFKKPKLLRMEVTAGTDSGSVLLFRNQGMVRIKQGKGIGSLVPFSLKPENPWICNLQGFGVDKSDWGWFIDEHLHISPLFSGRIQKKEVLNGRPARVYELVSANPSQTMNISRELLWVDEQIGMPMKYNLYNAQGKLVQSMLCWNVNLNTGLSESLFIEFDKKL